jgi:transposase, IS5 family
MAKSKYDTPSRPDLRVSASRFVDCVQTIKIYVAGQKRGLTPTIKRAFRRAAVEPVIGHLKNEHRMGRNHLAHSTGDAINAVLTAVGYNFRRLLT